MRDCRLHAGKGKRSRAAQRSLGCKKLFYRGQAASSLIVLSVFVDSGGMLAARRGNTSAGYCIHMAFCLSLSPTICR